MLPMTDTIGPAAAATATMIGLISSSLEPIDTTISIIPCMIGTNVGK